MDLSQYPKIENPCILFCEVYTPHFKRDKDLGMINKNKKYSKYLTKVLLLSIAIIISKNGYAQTHTTKNVTGNWEDTNSWYYDQYNPVDYTGVTITGAGYNIYGNITRTGNLTENTANLDIYGNLTIIGGAFNNNGAGVVVHNGAVFKIYGDFNAVSSVTVEFGGTLVVYGNLNVNSGSMAMNGDVVVKGNVLVNGTGTSVSTNGNLVLGGNFNFAGGGFTLGGTGNKNFYVYSSSATVSTPAWDNDVCNAAKTSCYYGNATTFNNNESQPLKDLVASVMGCMLSTPTALSACTGSSGSFYVLSNSAGGSAQWQYSSDAGGSWNNVPSSSPYSTSTGTYSTFTSYTLSISTLNSTMNGYLYRCSATGTCPATSSSATLTVYSLPVITAQPTNVTTCNTNSSNQTFTVGATGSNLSYSWQSSTDGTNWTNLSNSYPYSISGANLSISSYSYSSNVLYRSQVSSNGCTVNSANATLVYSTPAAAGTISGTASTCKGTSGVSYSVASIVGATSYIWAYSGSGATISNNGTSVAIDFSSVATSGNLTVKGSNSCGNGTVSPSFSIAVNSGPSITTQPSSVTQCNGTNASLSVVASGSGLTYQWQKNNSNIPGATSNTLNLTNISSSDAANYNVIVTSSSCSNTSNSAALSVTPSPSITSQPVSLSQSLGTTATFSVSASGSSISYQWRKAGTNIAGANSNNLVYSNLAAGNAGNYDVIVTNVSGCVSTSSIASLAVTSVPGNDNFSAAYIVSSNYCSSDAAYTTLNASPDLSKGSTWPSGPSYNVWFKFQATTPVITVNLQRGNSKGNVQRLMGAIWQSDGTTQVTSNCYVYDTDNVTVESIGLTVGNWYYLSVDNNYSGYQGSFTLCLSDQADYDFLEGAITLTTNSCSTDAAYTTVGATADRSKGTNWVSGPNYNRWFKFQATTQFASVQLQRGSTKGTAQRLMGAIWQSDGTTQVSTNCYVNDGDNVTVGTTALTIGNWYYISVDNDYSGYRGTFTICLSDQPDYDFKEGAITLTQNTCSTDAAYTTVGATPDKNKGTSWVSGPNYNRWFKFQATTQYATIQLQRGSSKGTAQRLMGAIWQSDGTTQVTSNCYVYDTDNVTVGSTTLTIGNWYYISVDNDYSGYRGTFTICLSDQPDYDFKEGAITLTQNTCSTDAAYTTVGATSDKNKGTSWVSGPNYNRWFKFQATTQYATVQLQRGSSKGTAQRLMGAIWQSDGTTQVTSNCYVYDTDNVTVGSTTLTIGNWYYISVDNDYSGYRGTFTICLSDQPDYDFKEGAITLTQNTCSTDAAYTTVGATPDKNKGTSWVSGPNYNRWFKFQATTQYATVQLQRGSTKGTAQRLMGAIWQSDGTTQVVSNCYVNDGDNITVGTTALTIGNWYYISVDNDYSGYRGTFTICLSDQPDYDFKEGAITLTANTCSTDAAYTTVGATPDKNKGTSWVSGPNYNRWFKFQATTTTGTVNIQRGSTKGTVQRLMAAIWQSDGTTQVASNRYVNDGDNLSVTSNSLTVGNWYYISVDNDYSGYRGTFTICLYDGYNIWNGSVDTDWNNPNNWSINSIPNAGSYVIIPSGLVNYPQINNGVNAQANSVLVQPNAGLAVPTGKSLTIATNLTVQSNPSGTGSLITNGTLTVSGTTTIERYLSAGAWHYTSIPVSSAMSSKLTNPPTSSYFDPNLLYYNENYSTSNWMNGWTQAYTNSTTPSALSVGKGYIIYLDTSPTISYTGTPNTGNYSVSITNTSRGNANHEGWNLVGNPYPSALDANAFIAANPSITGTLYYWDESGPGAYDSEGLDYASWNGAGAVGSGNGTIVPNNYISSGQSFFVKSTAASGTVNFTNAMRTLNIANFFKKGQRVQRAYLDLKSESKKVNQTLIAFKEDATDNLDIQYDGYKLKGNKSLSFYSLFKQSELAIQTLKQLDTNDSIKKTIPLGMDLGSNGNYSISLNRIENLDQTIDIYLHDLKFNQFINLKTTKAYSFYQDSGRVANRFEVLFTNVGIQQPTEIADQSIKIYASPYQIHVDIDTNDDVDGTVQVMNILGQVITKKEYHNDYRMTFPMSNASCVYVVKLTNKKGTTTKKVFVSE